MLKLDEDNYAQIQVEASIPLATVNTGDEQRDGHLKSADFFDAEKFPAMTFKSTNIESTGGGDYEVTGDLTIHGVTKPVLLKWKRKPTGEGSVGEPQGRAIRLDEDQPRRFRLDL